jgi:xylono-1,5-lactonase
MVRLIANGSRSRLGEGPLWSHSQNSLYWVDINGQLLRRLDLDDETVTAWPMPEPIGWVIERERAGSFVAGLASGFALLDLEPFRLTPIFDPEPDQPGNRLNDAKADAAGRIWAGTIACDMTPDCGALYRFDPDGRCTKADGPYTIANGPAISADGRTLYHTDSARRRVYRFNVDVEGLLGPRSLFVEFREEWGYPDGMTLDAEGGVWIAHWGGSRVSRFTPDGTVDRSIALPTPQVTSCTFAGRDLDRMFVTTASDGVEEDPVAGALFEVDPRCRGTPTLKYAG